jgi:Na+/H+-translocating membrane pyrophosphatase
METHEEPVTSYRSSLELEGSLLIRGIQIGEMSKLGWLIGLVKHVIWADYLYFLYRLLISISKMLAVQGIHVEAGSNTTTIALQV